MSDMSNPHYAVGQVYLGIAVDILVRDFLSRQPDPQAAAGAVRDLFMAGVAELEKALRSEVRPEMIKESPGIAARVDRHVETIHEVAVTQCPRILSLASRMTSPAKGTVGGGAGS